MAFTEQRPLSFHRLGKTCAIDRVHGGGSDARVVTAVRPRGSDHVRKEAESTSLSAASRPVVAASGAPCTAAAERFGIGSLVALAP